MDSSTGSTKRKALENVHTLRSPNTIAIVDSRSCFIESLLSGIRAFHKGVPIIAFNSIEELTGDLKMIKSGVSMVILSLDMTGPTLLTQNLSAIRAVFNDNTRIVLTSDHPSASFATQVCENGVCGLIPSSYSTDQFVACLKAIEAGVVFLPSELTAQHLQKSPLPDQLSSSGVEALNGALTPRQIQVLKFLSVGRSNKYIAAELNLCESTVKVHVSEIMRRLGATSRTHASYMFSKMSQGELG